MTQHRSAFSLTVTAPSGQPPESEIDQAVQTAITEALKEGTQGIKVTRHDYATFTVELAEDVTFGTTLEIDLVEHGHTKRR
ncbi:MULTISPECIES: hypothetical protein [Arthrobacter]|uniref:Uncharacterized protein n=1 Tax=Arthrobacter terricola TaxID=2547396 RepID=A0A4R5K721_9MICC|nr:MULTISPECIES: hypothetical protein [Arthrobacter]MBT8163503.1 hypothetical protein [Arthrobacter sp. GN70]TDF89452.1 hypothetical protein E1809_22865 [Arthrobacter terricola]